jgi:ferredoxin-NADP reductase
VLALVLAAGCALFWTRVFQPYAATLRPYRVSRVRRERGDAVTLELAPDGHRGLRFAPGQFARVRAGDFSSAIATLAPGTRVLVDGPHGEAAQPTSRRGGLLLLAAGIGITPALSVIRTAAERGEQRPLLLLYGNRRWAEVTFREELDELRWRMPHLQVVHVLSRPEDGWMGERGRLGAETLRRHAPADVARWNALICGPPGMVAATSSELRRLGMPSGAIQAEGFA